MPILSKRVIAMYTMVFGMHSVKPIITVTQEYIIFDLQRKAQVNRNAAAIEYEKYILPRRHIYLVGMLSFVIYGCVINYII